MNEKEYVKQLFPTESEEKAVELIERMKRLVPINCSDKIGYLETIIMYVDGLINGDDISQYTTYEYLTKFAIKGFDEIINDVQKRMLEKYREERRNLQNEILSLKENLSELELAHKNITRDIQELQADKERLQTKRDALSGELFALNSDLEETKRNGLTRVEEEVSDRQETLKNEIELEEKKKKQLEEAILELQNKFNEYSNMLEKLNSKEEEVVWEPIDKDDPIYNTNAESITSYIESLIITYMDKMQVSREEALKEFKKNCPSLEEFEQKLKQFDFSDKNCGSVRSIINYEYWDYLKHHSESKMLEAMLKNFRMPKYQSKNKNIDTIGLSIETVPIETKTMLREIYLERLALEAMAKQRIAEAELKTVIAILSKVAPQESYVEIFKQYNEMDKLIYSDENSDLKLR